MIHEAIAKVVLRQDLTEAEMMAVMEEIGENRATPAQIGALLVALSMKGERVEEITGAARVLRARSLRIPMEGITGPIVDTCGTGGDRSGTFNVSTTAAFVVAGCGLTVAKHGNRSVSSRCGSADVLEALGVDLNLAPEDVGLCLRETGVGFLFAPMLHPVMRHTIHPRREIGLKSVFNLVGPLTNPAGADVQVMGVFDGELTEKLALVLARLGCKGAFVVHGLDGVDEISITGPTRMTRLLDGRVSTGIFTPEEAGLNRARPEDVLGGDACLNAEITLRILNGENGPRRDMVLLNAAAALVAAGRAGDMRNGVELAAEAIDRGEALKKLEALAAMSRRLAPRREAVGG